jgi:hypothetical protein
MIGRPFEAMRFNGLDRGRQAGIKKDLRCAPGAGLLPVLGAQAQVARRENEG